MRLDPFLNCQSHDLLRAKKYYVPRIGLVHFEFRTIPAIGAQGGAKLVHFGDIFRPDPLGF